MTSAEKGEAERIRRAWAALELPEPDPAPPGFAQGVLSAASAERSVLPGFALSPAWAGLAALLLVVTGVIGGMELGLTAPAADGADSFDLASFESAAADATFWADDGLLDGSLFDDESESVAVDGAGQEDLP